MCAIKISFDDSDRAAVFDSSFSFPINLKQKSMRMRNTCNSHHMVASGVKLIFLTVSAVRIMRRNFKTWYLVYFSFSACRSLYDHLR